MERMGVYSTIHHPSAKRLQVVKERIKDFEFEVIENIDDAWTALDTGDLDLILAPANIVWNERVKLASMQFDVIAALTRNHPHHVLVSEDGLEHFPAGGVILCEEPLISRQIRRRRAKIDIRTYASMEIESDTAEGLHTAQNLVESGEINGFVTHRGAYDSAGLNGRRHALHNDPEARGVPRFVPTPFCDLIVIISRQGYPVHNISDWTDEHALNAWMVQRTVMHRTPVELHELIGVHYRQQQIGPILTEAERVNDLFVLDNLIDPECDVDDQPRYEIIVELLSEDGLRTTSMERIGPINRLGIDIQFMMNDWNNLLERFMAKEGGFIQP